MKAEESPTIQEKLLKTKRLDELSIPTFLKKTYEILDEQKYSNIISWNEEGDLIIIKDPIEFSQRVLPIFFKHNNLASFIRQLNMYDFRKRKNQQYEHVFTHDLFKRGRKDLLQNIKRKTTDHVSDAPVKAKSQTMSDSVQSENASLRQENENLKRYYKDLEQKTHQLENNIKELTVQNQILLTQLQRKAEREEQLKQYASMQGLWVPPGSALKGMYNPALNANPFLLMNGGNPALPLNLSQSDTSTIQLQNSLPSDLWQTQGQNAKANHTQAQTSEYGQTKTDGQINPLINMKLPLDSQAKDIPPMLYGMSNFGQNQVVGDGRTLDPRILEIMQNIIQQQQQQQSGDQSMKLEKPRSNSVSLPNISSTLPKK